MVYVYVYVFIKVMYVIIFFKKYCMKRHTHKSIFTCRFSTRK